jgi:hypothetical protein
MNLRLLFLYVLVALSLGSVAVQASPADLISDFRVKHGEGRVTMDATLNRIAQDQAQAMAAKETLDHGVLGSFNSRIAPAGSGRAAENIAYGYDSFEKTLGQWIDSSGHRQNLLLPHASRVGVANAKSASGRMYWAMVIAGDYEASPKLVVAGDKPVRVTKKRVPAQSCRATILGLCF